MTRNKTWLGALGALLLSSSVGCGPAVIGEWESQKPIQDQKNDLVVDDIGVADATIWILRTIDLKPTAQSFRYAVEWEERREGTAYSFDLTCKESPYGECDPEDDLRMLCSLAGDDDQLTCDVDEDHLQRWGAYEFSWRKVD